jgi:protein kinase-like protein
MSASTPSNGPILEDALNRDPSDKLLWGTPYRTLERRGGPDLAEIVIAVRIADGLRVQIKLLRLDFLADAETVDERKAVGQRVRLDGEAQQKIRHPNLCSVLDVGETPDGRPFFVTELLEGAEPLSSVLLAKGALPVAEALSIAIDVLSALGAAHAAGVVHRDVKPQNVLLIEEGGARVVKLTDFGIAKVIAGGAGGPAPLANPTAPGERLGSPRYMSPEGVLGKKAIDARSDVYQVGLVLYEMLAGRGPFDEISGSGGLLQAHAVQQAPRLGKVVKQAIPDSLEAAVTKALRKAPAERFATAADFAAALREIIARDVGDAARGALKALGAGGTEVVDRAAARAAVAAIAAREAEAMAPSPRADRPGGTDRIEREAPPSPVPSEPTASEPENEESAASEAAAIVREPAAKDAPRASGVLAVAGIAVAVLIVLALGVAIGRMFP